MSAQILLFPANRIRRLTCSGVMSSDMVIVSAVSKIPKVEHNCRVDLLYAVFNNVLSSAIKKK